MNTSSKAPTNSTFSQGNLIWWLLGIASLIRLAAIVNKGVLYDGHFDDAIGFMRSAMVLAADGRLSFYAVAHSAREMPGYPAFLAVFFLLSKNTFVVYLMAKVALVLISVASIYVLYLLGRRIGGVRVGLVAAVLLTFSMPHVYTGTLTLSENPFMLLLLLATLFLIRLADEPSWRNLAVLIIVFCAALYIKQGAVGFLPPAALYLIARRYPWDKLVKHVFVAGIVIVLALTPWWVRNYYVFGQFVPFTSYAGAPFFEGTFQRFLPYGTGEFAAMDQVLRGSSGSELAQSLLLERAGQQRLQARWAEDPRGVLYTYLVAKPVASWALPFYWDKVFGISGFWIARIHALVAALGLALLAWFSFRSRARAEFLLMFLNVVVITVGSAYYLGLSRFVYPYMPYLFVAVAYLVDMVAVLLAARWGNNPQRAKLNSPHRVRRELSVRPAHRP